MTTSPILPNTGHRWQADHRPSSILLYGLTIIIVFLTASAGCLDDITFPWDDDDSRETDEYSYYIAAAPQTLDPAVAYDDISLNIINNLYERLMTYRDRTGTDLVPMVARNMVKDNDRSYTFLMRDNYRFASGRIIQAEDVAYSISRVLTMGQQPSWMLSQVLNQSGIEIGDFDFDGIPDVRFLLSVPYSGFPHIMAFSVSSIVDRELVEQNGGVESGRMNDWMALNSAGSGPYRVRNWDNNSPTLVLTRNTNYRLGWEKDQLKKVIFRVEESETLRFNAITGKKADQADIPLSLLGNLTEVISVRTQTHDTLSVVFFGFNTETAPFDDLNVRRAFSYIFNYNDMLTTILEGKYGDRLYGPIPPGVVGYDRNPMVKFFYDPSQALHHLESAGYTVTDGRVIDFPPLTLSAPSNASAIGRIMHQFSENLADVGITVDIRYIDIAGYLRGIDRGEFPVFITGWNADYADPDNFVFPLLHSDGSNLSINPARYSNTSVDRLIEDGKKTLSPSERQIIYRDIQNAVNGDVPYLWLYQPKAISVLKADITGFNLHPILGTNYYDITIVG